MEGVTLPRPVTRAAWDPAASRSRIMGRSIALAHPISTCVPGDAGSPGKATKRSHSRIHWKSRSVHASAETAVPEIACENARFWIYRSLERATDENDWPVVLRHATAAFVWGVGRRLGKRLISMVR